LNRERYSYTNSSGQYICQGLETGDYYVEADGYVNNQRIYVRKYYDNVSDQSSATPVTVTAPDTITGIDFTLEQGGAISGTVYESDGTTPIANTDRKSVV